MAMRSQAIGWPGPAEPSAQRLATNACVTRKRPRDADDRRAGLDAQAGLARRLRPFALRLVPEVGDDGDLDARLRQFQRGAIGRIMRGRDDGARAGLYAVAGEKPARRFGQHDSRPVVVGEHQRALMRAGRQHDAVLARTCQRRSRGIFGSGAAR